MCLCFYKKIIRLLNLAIYVLLSRFIFFKLAKSHYLCPIKITYSKLNRTKL